MSKISRVKGKNTELAIAKIMKAKRNHFEAEDLRHPILSIEVKHRKKLPVLITKFMGQAVAACSDEKIPCVVMHEGGAHHTDDLVIMRLYDLEDLVGRVMRGSAEESE
ncbi:MAG: hypothetical protein K940chlam2_01410 [Chlamydiae bacterium]|nr:hypothetical protein [Chlamydiota bacterium]